MHRPPGTASATTHPVGWGCIPSGGIKRGFPENSPFSSVTFPATKLHFGDFQKGGHFLVRNVGNGWVAGVS